MRHLIATAKVLESSLAALDETPDQVSLMPMPAELADDMTTWQRQKDASASRGASSTPTRGVDAEIEVSPCWP